MHVTDVCERRCMCTWDIWRRKWDICERICNMCENVTVSMIYMMCERSPLYLYENASVYL